MIGQTLGHYHIVEKIGAGGMGEVYRAHDERLDRDVALKVLPAGMLTDEDARKRFRKEALALSKLNHPNIATVHDFDTQDGIDFLVMEFVDGMSLAEKLKGGLLREKETAALGMQVADALEEARERGIIHRDLKPGNILVTPKGRVKVLDFGLAKFLHPTGDLDATQSIAETRVVAGTLPYMAPEQLQGEPVDTRTDLYALGVVLYEMTTGQRPFRHEVSTRLADMILHQPPVQPRAMNRRISPELENIVLKCLEKDPESRYQSAKELGVDLRRLGPVRSQTTAAAVTPAGALARRKPLFLWAGAVALLASLLALVIFLPGKWRERLAGRPTIPRIQSLAVLPLENLSHDPGQDYLADGMTDELITELGQVGSLKVISRTSALHYKGTNKRIPEIASELNVGGVVQGSVLRSGNRVRITVQLTDAATDQNLWGQSYERDMGDVFTLQDEVARAITGQIQARLTPQEQTRLASSHNVNPEAYNDYLKGRYFYYQRTDEGYRKASEYLQQAITKDPNYAAAWALWAGTAYDPLLSDAENAKRSHEALQKALQLDDSLSEVHTEIASEKMQQWDWGGAETELRRAIELNPNYAEAHHTYSHYLMGQSRVEDSLRESQRALEADPVNVAMIFHLAWHYFYAHQYDQAIAQCRRTLDFDPNYQPAHFYLAAAEAQRGEYAEAIAEFQKFPAFAGGKEGSLGAWLGRTYALAGDKAEALKIADRLLQLRGKNPGAPYNLAIIYLGLGDKERSLAFLKEAVDAHAVEIFIDPINKSPIFDSLRSEPRFQNLLRRIGLPP
jgi:TolB-like protein/Tfp pilus assembly protein PilF/predicted Ser/Thr protein kinase